MGLDKRIVNAALLHHERCDGSGYPLGVKGDKLDEFTKIIAIADVYEALTANRVYRKSMCPFDAIAHFEKKDLDYMTPKFYLFLFIIS